MKRHLFTMTVLGGLALASAGMVAAETSSKPPAAHDHGASASSNDMPPGKGGMGMGMMGHEGMCSMMGGGAMGMGGMGAMMAMGGADTQVAVKNTDKGVTITLTATDPGKVVRLQKMAEAMRLMHEANAQ